MRAGLRQLRHGDKAIDVGDKAIDVVEKFTGAPRVPAGNLPQRSVNVGVGIASKARPRSKSITPSSITARSANTATPS
jgi:hypothetical protein